MPPEPLPWDRKEFVFKDRKHERGPPPDALAAGCGGGGGSTPRWREPYHGPRDFPRASPRRPPPPSYHRQNGGYYQLYPDESPHGCTPSRSGERFWLEEEGFRPSSRYNGGRSGGGGRESRGSFRRSPYYDSGGDFSRPPSHHGSPVVTSSSQRSVAVPIISSPHIPPLKDQNDKSGGDDQRSDRERERDHSLGSIGWKKWARPGSVSALSKAAARPEPEEVVGLEVSVPQGKETPVRSPVSSPLLSDDGISRKKPRLGWGQGLAKYEKQKVDGSGSGISKDQVSETSPKVMGLPGSLSPATPCSAACNLFPGVDDMPFSKVANAGKATSHCSDSSALIPQNCSEELSFKFHELSPTCMLTSLLADLLQPEDACCGDSTFTRNGALNKLLLFKADISKELEKTECEIDLFESELRSLNFDEGSGLLQNSSTLQANGSSTACTESTDGSLKELLKSNPVISSAVSAVGEQVVQACSSDECKTEVTDPDNNTSQITSYNICQSSTSGKEVSDVDAMKLVECVVAAENDGLPLDVGEGVAIVHDPGDESHLNAGNSNADANVDASSHGKSNDNLIDLIIASNKDAARKASQVFDKALSHATPRSDIWGSDGILSHRKNDIYLKEKLAMHKQQLTFKERVLTLKFRAFHHLWKEDLRLLSIRKQRPKSHKRFELSSRSSQCGSQKHRSSIRSRFALPAGNLTLVPTADIIDFTSRLLSDSQIKLYRNSLKMPALILDERERRRSRFITTNSLIEDPHSFEKERAMINPWTQEEKGVFMEMLATFGKDFSKISSFLSHKTTADCIEFYYKNHKSESFRDVKKQLDLRKQQWRGLPTNAYLVTSGKKWNREGNSASLDMLGEVSVAAAHNNGSTRNQQKCAGRAVVPNFHDSKVSRSSFRLLERANSADVSSCEKEATAADVLAGICGALSLEAVSSCVTSSISPTERRNHVMLDRPLTPEVTQAIEEEDTCSDDGCGEMESMDWTDEEKSMLIRALSMYGKDFARISLYVGTKSRNRCKTFFSKARKCLGLDHIHPGDGNVGMLTSDMNGGRSDTDDACAAEIDSTICSTQSCSKMDVDFTQSIPNTSSEGFANAGNTSLQTEADQTSEQYEAGGSNQEDIRGNVDVMESVIDDNKTEDAREHLQPDNILEEMGEAAFRCEGAELSLDGETRKAETSPMDSPAEPDTNTCAEGEKLKSQEVDDFQQEFITGGSSSADGLKSEVDLQQLPVVIETVSGESQSEKIGRDTGSDISLPFAADSSVNDNACHTTVEISACPNSSFRFATSCQEQMPVELLPCIQNKSQTMSFKSGTVPQRSPVLHDPPSICSEDPLRAPSQSNLNFEEHLNKQHQELVVREFYQQFLSQKLPLSKVDQPFHIPGNYPLQILNQESKRDASLISGKPVILESHSKGLANSQLNKHLSPEVPHEKCNGSVVSNSVPGMSFPSRSDMSESQLRPCSQNAGTETEEQYTRRTGDVKLFGQILSNPTSLQKPNSSSQESDCRPLSPKERSAAMKPSTSRKDSSGSHFATRQESRANTGQTEVPLRSYGFWDGNRIQTGFSSLPESIMLAKYQGPVPGIPLYSAKDAGGSSNNVVLTDYQQPYVQPLSADGKRLDGFPELQKRNGFEMVSGFQQQGRAAAARLGVNVVGGGRSILVSSSGGVSDPVAALKMQFAASAGRAKFLTSSELEPWREIEDR